MIDMHSARCTLAKNGVELNHHQKLYQQATFNPIERKQNEKQE